MTTVVVTCDESDALRVQALARLSGIDDVFHAVESRDFATAERLGVEFLDLLTLLGQLGWQEVGGEDRQRLEMPAEQLRRLFHRLLIDAEELHKAAEREASEAWQDLASDRERSLRVAATSRRIVCEVGSARSSRGD